MFQGEGSRRRINSTEDAAKCLRAGMNWLRRFYMVERISLQAFWTDSRFPGVKLAILVSDPDPKPITVSDTIRVGISASTWHVRRPVSRTEPYTDLSRIDLERSQGFSVDPINNAARVRASVTTR
jgi:hypothetical protein